ncbi:hypothetical protein GCK32_001411 [Trichostrongylus colubriformis]|uniref:Uncharacterized protein n=1 Tax=Trichostrongylus colubriformis TaxID=6319 RepID=A0AAN8EZW1_TRICO
MNNGVRILLEEAYPRCLPLLQARGLRSETPNSTGIKDIRDNYTEAANKSRDMAQPIKEKLKDGAKVVREVVEKAGDEVEQLKEKVERKDEGRKNLRENKDHGYA